MNIIPEATNHGRYDVLLRMDHLLRELDQWILNTNDTLMSQNRPKLYIPIMVSPLLGIYFDKA